MKTVFKKVFFALFGLGVVLRFVGAWWYRNDPNPDYAVVVEMVHNMVTGMDWPIFFYGQGYMGSLEPSVSALFAWLIPNVGFATCLGTAFFGVLLMLAAGLYSARVAGWRAGCITLALLLIGPPGYFQYMASPRGGYALGLLLIVLLLGQASELSRKKAGEHSVWGIVLLGLYAGLGFWNFWLVLPAVAAAGVLLLLTWRGRLFCWKTWIPAVAAFGVGSAPFWVWNASHGWASFGMSGGGTVSLGAKHAVKQLFVSRLPHLLGVNVWLMVGILAFVGWIVWMVLREIKDVGAKRLVQAWLLFGAFFGLVYGVSTFGQTETPRYLLPIVPGIALFVGMAAGICWKAGFTRRAWVFCGIAVCLVAFRMGSLGQLWARGHLNDAHAETARERIRVLKAEGVEAILSSYRFLGDTWMGDFQLPVSCPSLERRAWIGRAAERAQNIAIYENAFGVDHFLKATGGEADYGRIAGLRVHRNFRAPPAVLSYASSVLESIHNAEGRDITRRLCSARMLPEPSTECVEVTLKSEMEVAGVRLELAPHAKYDRLSVEVLAEDGKTFVEVVPPLVHSGYYWSGPRPYWARSFDRSEVRFPACKTRGLRLHFTQGGGPLLGMHVLRLDPAPEALDVEAIAAAIEDTNARHVWADRWLGEMLRPRVKRASVSYEPTMVGEPMKLHWIRPSSADVIVAERHALPAIRAGLEAAKVEFTESPVGGVVLLSFPANRGTNPQEKRLLFNGVSMYVSID